MLRVAALALASVVAPCAQQQELGLTLGRVLQQDRGRLHLGPGTALQANYGYRILSGDKAALYLETHFLANAARALESTSAAATRDLATLYLTGVPLTSVVASMRRCGAFSGSARRFATSTPATRLSTLRSPPAVNTT